MNRREILEREWEIDLEEQHREFKTIVPRSNLANWAKWFKLHSELNPYEHAIIAGVTPSTISYWQYKLGLRQRRKGRKYFKGPLLSCQSLPKPPDNWDSQWLAEQYLAGYSTRQLAKMVSRNFDSIYDRLNRVLPRLRTQGESVHSRNPCATKEWLHEHYVNQCLSLRKCARLANVNIRTVRSWLIRFGIRVRSTGEAMFVQHHGYEMAKEFNPRARKASSGG